MNAYANYKTESTGSGLFFKFEDGKTTKFRIISDEPVVFNTEFKADGEEPKISTKYAWVVYNRTEDKVQILQLPKTGFGMVQDLAVSEDWGDPTGYDLAIKREGKGLETRYSISPTPKSEEVPKEKLDEAREIDLKEKMKASEYNMNVMTLTEAGVGLAGAEDVSVDLNDLFPEE